MTTLDRVSASLSDVVLYSQQASASATSTAQRHTDTALNGLLASLSGGVAYDRTKSYATNDQVIYGGSVWRATAAVPAGLAPMGVGDGSLADQQLLVSDAVDGIASFAGVTGGLGGTVRVVNTNADDSSGATAGSLRYHLKAHRTAWLADPSAKSWIVFDKTFNDGSHGAGVYRISLAADLNLELVTGNLTIDGRGCDIIVSGGGGFTGCTAVGKAGPKEYGKTTTTMASGTTVISLSSLSTASTPLAVGYKVDLYKDSDPTVKAVASGVVTAFDTTAKTVTISAPGLTNATDGSSYTLVPYGRTAGVVGRAWTWGGRLYSDFATSNPSLIPAGNIIVSNLAIINNWGGDTWNTGSKPDWRINCWLRGMVIDHCTFTNPDIFHDALLDAGGGSTDITVRWCKLYQHYKSSQWWTSVDSTNAPWGNTLPPMFSTATPPAGASTLGNYDIWNPNGAATHGNKNGLPEAINRSTWHHNYWSEVGQRAPKVDQHSKMHVYNSVNEDWGLTQDDDGFYRFPLVSTGGSPTGGVQTQALNGAHMRMENTIFTAANGATLSALLALRNVVGSEAKGYTKTSGLILENGASYDGDYLPTSVWDPSLYYSYTVDPVDTTAHITALRTAVKTGAGAGKQSVLWQYVSAASVPGSIRTQDAAGDIGPSGAQALAGTIKFTGGATLSYDTGTKTTTVNVSTTPSDATTGAKGVVQLAGDLAGTAAAPTVPGLTAKATDTAVVHNTGAETVAGVKTFSSSPIVPTPTTSTQAANKSYVDSQSSSPPGTVLGRVEYWPTGSQTDVTTISATPIDLANSAATLGTPWTGVTINTFDVSFTVPASGSVSVEAEVFGKISVTGQAMRLCVLDVTSTSGSANAGTIVTNSQANMITGTTGQMRLRYVKKVSGLTVGATLIYRLGWLSSSTSGTSTISAGGILGPVRFGITVGT